MRSLSLSKGEVTELVEWGDLGLGRGKVEFSEAVGVIVAAWPFERVPSHACRGGSLSLSKRFTELAEVVNNFIEKSLVIMARHGKVAR